MHIKPSIDITQGYRFYFPRFFWIAIEWSTIWYIRPDSTVLTRIHVHAHIYVTEAMVHAPKASLNSPFFNKKISIYYVYKCMPQLGPPDLVASCAINQCLFFHLMAFWWVFGGISDFSLAIDQNGPKWKDRKILFLLTSYFTSKFNADGVST